MTDEADFVAAMKQEAANVAEIRGQVRALLRERDVLRERVNDLDETVREILDYATGWTGHMSPGQRLKRITELGNAVLSRPATDKEPGA